MRRASLVAVLFGLFAVPAAFAQVAPVIDVSEAIALPGGNFQVSFDITSPTALQIGSFQVNTSVSPQASTFTLLSSASAPGGVPYSTATNPVNGAFVVSVVNIGAFGAPANIPAGIPTNLGTITFSAAPGATLTAIPYLLDVTSAEVVLNDANSTELTTANGQLSALDGSITVVPEPATLGLLAVAGLGLLRRRGRATA